MKKISVLLTSILFFNSFSQENLNKISNNASVVLSIKGENILKKVPENLINTSPIFAEFQREFFRNAEQKIAIGEFGVDFSEDIHFVIEDDENLTSFYAIYPLKSKSKFEKALNPSSWGEKVNGKGYEGYVTQYGNDFLVWDKKLAVYIDCKYKGDSYSALYDYDYYLEEAMKNEVLEGYLKSGELVKEYDKVQKKYEKIKLERAKQSYSKREPLEFDRVNSADHEDYYDRMAEVRDYFSFKQQEEREKLQKQIEEEEKKVIASRLENFFKKGGVENPITSSKEFMASRDASSDGIFWSRNGVFFPMFMGYRSYRYGPKFNYNDKSVGGMTANIYLEQTQARVKMTSFYGDSIKKYTQKILSTTLNEKLLNYINKDALGYYSLSFSMEQMLHAFPYYYKSAYGKLNDRYKSQIDLGMDFLKILLDEKDAAKILSGDAVFVLLGIEKKEVTYQTYEMDEDYNYIEVTKTKKEPLPKFRLAMLSQTPELFNKIMEVAVKEGAFTKEKDYYFSEGKKKQFPIAVYAKYDNGVVLVSTEVADMKGVSGAKIDQNQLTLIKNNSSVIYYNNEKMLQQIPMDEIRNKKQRKLFNYLLNHSKDAVFTQSHEDGEIKGELVVNIPEGEENSGMYFFNLMNKIIEIDKEGRE